MVFWSLYADIPSPVAGKDEWRILEVFRQRPAFCDARLISRERNPKPEKGHQRIEKEVDRIQPVLGENRGKYKYNDENAMLLIVTLLVESSKRYMLGLRRFVWHWRWCHPRHTCRRAARDSATNQRKEMGFHNEDCVHWQESCHCANFPRKFFYGTIFTWPKVAKKFEVEKVESPNPKNSRSSRWWAQTYLM